MTTTTCGAVKEGIRDLGHELGLYTDGGKGAASCKTPQETITACERLSYEPDTLVYTSRLSAKVDNSAVQDDSQLYHHCFFFTREGQWCVVQQGVPHTITTGWDIASIASSTSPAMPGEGP